MKTISIEIRKGGGGSLNLGQFVLKMFYNMARGSMDTIDTFYINLSEYETLAVLDIHSICVYCPFLRFGSFCVQFNEDVIMADSRHRTYFEYTFWSFRDISKR